MTETEKIHAANTMLASEGPHAKEIDRSGWPPGPWDGEPDKLQWKTGTGLPGLIVRNRSGALCGYVGVPPGHPAHGKDYGDLEDVSVHGGLTYSNLCDEENGICHVSEPGEPDDVHWLGFDTAHGGDLVPGFQKSARELRLHSFGGTYRDVAYVRGEVERLAAQLAVMA